MGENSKIEIIVSGLASKLVNLLDSTTKSLVIVSPWIKYPGSRLICDNIKNKNINIEIYSRFSTLDFIKGSSDIEAFTTLFNNFPNLIVGCVPNLHAKVYIADDLKAIITSGNLTFGGLKNNMEAGILINESNMVNDLTKNIRSLFQDSFKLNHEKFNHTVNLFNINEVKKSSRANDQINNEKIENLVIGRAIRPPDDGVILKSLRKDFKIDVLDTKIIEKRFEPGRHGKIILDNLNKDEYISKVKPELLEQAFIHSSEEVTEYLSNFDRLQTLGIDLLNFIISSILYQKFGKKYGANLIRLIADYYKGTYLNGNPIINGIDLSSYILSKDKSKKVINHSKVALIAVIYLSIGIEGAIKFLQRDLPINENINLFEVFILNDSKSALMEIIQLHNKKSPTYKDLKVTGPDNNRLFESGVYSNEEELGRGTGSSKKEAEKSAAVDALNKQQQILKEIPRWIQMKERKELLRRPQNYFISPQRKLVLENLSKILSIEDIDLYLLNNAVTHPTWRNDMGLPADDKFYVLNYCGSQLWEFYTQEVTFMNTNIKVHDFEKVRTELNKLLVIIFNKLDLSHYGSFGKTESGESEVVKSHFIYTLIWVIYLQKGYYHLRKTLNILLKPYLEKILNNSETLLSDPKGQLQSMIQVHSTTLPVYKLIEITGPNHNPRFKVAVSINDVEYGIGEGRSGKDAEREAAIVAITRIASNQADFLNQFK